MKSHLRRWGAIYILVVLWLGSAAGQFAAQAAEGEGWVLFASSTFENWQSEFLQLTVQGLLIVGMAGKLFRVSKKDQERLEAKIDKLLEQKS